MSDKERPHALGPLELVGRHCQQIYVQRPQVDIDVRRGLDRIDVDQDALVATYQRRYLRDRLDCADFVVGEHDTDQDRLGRNGRLDVVRIDTAVAIHRQLHDLETELLEIADSVADRVMLDRACDDPVAASLAGPGRTLEGEIVGLSAAGREDDLAGSGAEARATPSWASSSPARARRPKLCSEEA